MRSGLHGAFAVVIGSAAPENRLSRGVFALEFQPDIEGIHRATRKEVADLHGSNNNVDANACSRLECRTGFVHWCRNIPRFAQSDLPGLFRLFSHRERGGELRT